uniref:hypothetical protein n=1 Tax=Rhodococcus qingshengii TaxID=334542 RepID=UPI002119D139|nr:hypothetical protein [Rhodococcus qingshengii]
MLGDTAIAGRSSYVALRVRRFLCSNTGCDRRTLSSRSTDLPRLTHGPLRCCAKSSRRSRWR